MTRAAPIAALLVDWGTSHLRVWAMSPEGNILAERHGNEGMGAIERTAYPGIFADYAASLGATDDVPALACGMAGSRQGWQEATYGDLPCDLAQLPSLAVKVAGERRDVRILPGVARRDIARPDVMRSEETQLLGYWQQSTGAVPALVCMPGTHAKWVQSTDGGRVLTDFATSLTGDLYAALTGHTVLRHSVAGSPEETDAAAFAGAALASMAEPATLLMRLFSVRPQGLLHGAGAATARAVLSGTIIGQDVAGALARFGKPDRIGLVGGGALGPLYRTVLELAGIAVDEVDGDYLAIAGLAAAARQIWPTRFDEAQRAAS